MSDVCRDADGQAAVQAKVKTVTCEFDPAATKEKLGRNGPKLKLNKGPLTATYGWDTANMQDQTKAWLMKNL